ncbi:AzlC family ABC transporter permease [Daeguia caeni]|uniref:AzlC family ABC transporter permease n=1 Tax=Daeguia caeni TaxID=439612 RepID=A0ABV9H8D4_9HYPH
MIKGKASNAALFWEGFRTALPVTIAIMPFGMLFGAIAIDNGFTTADAVFMSAAIFAGASQMVGLELFGQHIAPWMIVLSIFAVNFRHVLYSAAVGRRIQHFSFIQKALTFFFLADPQYADVESRAEAGKPVTFIGYLGFSMCIYPMWVIDGYIGARFGKLIKDPYAWGIDFMLPMYFMCLVMGFRSREHWFPVVAASALSSILAYHFIGSPWHVSIGAIGGIAVAVILAKPKEANL